MNRQEAPRKHLPGASCKPPGSSALKPPLQPCGGYRSAGQTYDKAYSLCRCVARDGRVSAESQIAHKLRIGKVMALSTFDGRQSLQSHNLSLKITMQQLHTLLILIAGPTSTRRRSLQGPLLSNMQSPLQCCNCT